MNESKALIEIVKSVLNSTSVSESIDVDNWNILLQFAWGQGLIVFVYDYLNALPKEKRPSAEIEESISKLYASEVRRGIVQVHTVEIMQDQFERDGLYNMFIKGAVTKFRYPNDLLRSMGDIDFLYKEEQTAILKASMLSVGYNSGETGRVHDIYYMNKDICCEAHRQLLPSSSPYTSFCDGIWERSEKMSTHHYCYRMTIEDEIIFNIIHLASHFRKGGIGLRFILDVWIYSQENADWNLIHRRLHELKLEEFYKNMMNLARHWFGNTHENTDELLFRIEDYVLAGGVFGDSLNRSSAAIRGGKKKYFINILFPNYEEMRSMFPWLKNRALLPIAWIRRGFDAILYRRKNIGVLMKPLAKGDEDKAIQLQNFYSCCGL